MSVIIFQLGNVFTSDQSYFAKIAPIRFWLFSGKNYKESCFKEVIEYHNVN